MTNSATKPRKDLGLGELLLAFRRKMNDHLRKDFYGLDLTMAQMEVLGLIAEGRKPMDAIAGHLKIAPPSATVLVGKMERKGLVIRKRDKSDRRLVLIDLPPAVKKRVAGLLKKKEQFIRQFVSKLEEKDRHHLERIITILIKE